MLLSLSDPTSLPTPLPPPTPRSAGGVVGCSLHGGFSLLLPPSHTFPLIQRGLSMGFSPSGVSTCSTTVPSTAEGESLLRYLEHLLPSSDLGVPSVISICSLLHSLSCGFLTFLKHVFPEGPQSWLMGSAVPHSGSAGVGWNQLRLILGLSSQRPCL